MILYHGSNIKIEQIDLQKSKPFKDFGKGFYLSDNESQAHVMANFKALTMGGEPIVTAFEFKREDLLESGLSILTFDDYSLGWLDFVICNRRGIPTPLYDFVYGPIADDKVGLQLRKFNDKEITKEELLHRLKYIKGITFQYFFGTPAAINYLTRI